MNNGSPVPKHPPKPDAFEMFCYAEEFRASFDLLISAHEWILNARSTAISRVSQPGSEEWKAAFGKFFEIIPGQVSAQVLSALSLEIYLKCLHRVRRRKPPRGHNQKEIFDALSRKDRLDIEKRYLENYKGPTEALSWKQKVTLDSALNRASVYFTGIRYGYERPSPRSPEIEGMPGLLGNIGIPNATLSVRAVILSKHPEWEQRFLERRSLL
jgi:hypothetical protein